MYCSTLTLPLGGGALTRARVLIRRAPWRLAQAPSANAPLPLAPVALHIGLAAAHEVSCVAVGAALGGFGWRLTSVLSLCCRISSPPPSARLDSPAPPSRHR